MNSNMEYGQPKVWSCSFGVNVPITAAAEHQRHLLSSNFHLNKKLTRKAFYANVEITSKPGMFSFALFFKVFCELQNGSRLSKPV